VAEEWGGLLLSAALGLPRARNAVSQSRPRRFDVEVEGSTLDAAALMSTVMDPAWDAEWEIPQVGQKRLSATPVRKR
jgi:hypothetical protein